MNNTARKKRFCLRCGKLLSIYNDANTCRPCQKASSALKHSTRAELLPENVSPLRTSTPASLPWENSHKTGKQGALKTLGLGSFLHRYRDENGLTQAELAKILELDQSYISRLEKGDREGRDINFRKRIVERLTVPPHLLGLSPEHYATRHSAELLDLAPPAIRLASIAREAGRSKEAADQLWPFLVRLQAQAVEGDRTPELLKILAAALATFGVTLGDLLPEEQLSISARYLEEAYLIVESCEDRVFKGEVLRRYGNELRKVGEHDRAVKILETASLLADQQSMGAAAVSLARAYATTGQQDRFLNTVEDMHRALDAPDTYTAIFNPLVAHEVELRGFVELDRRAEVAETLKRKSMNAIPWMLAPQWRIIASITTAYAKIYLGEVDSALRDLELGLSEARLYKLPHQLQRGLRLAAQTECISRISPTLTTAHDFLTELKADSLHALYARGLVHESTAIP